MPHRVALIWHTFMFPASATAALGWMVGAMTADGIAAAITVVGVAVSVAMVRMAKPLGDAIREVGFAWAEVRGKMRRELSETTAKADDNAQAIDEMRRQVVVAREEAIGTALRVKAEAEGRYEVRLKAMRDEHDRQIEAVRREDQQREERRKVERQLQQNMILQLEDQLRESRRLDPRVARNEAAIDILATETNVELPPPPAERGET